MAYAPIVETGRRVSIPNFLLAVVTVTVVQSHHHNDLDRFTGIVSLWDILQ